MSSSQSCLVWEQRSETVPAAEVIIISFSLSPSASTAWGGRGRRGRCEGWDWRELDLQPLLMTAELRLHSRVLLDQVLDPHQVPAKVLPTDKQLPLPVSRDSHVMVT